MNWFTIYAIVLASCWVGLSFYLICNRRKVRYLRDVNVANFSLPSVAIIVAVRNEEGTIEEALRSLCKLRYRYYRIIVVNDRSTDNTPIIVTKVASEYTHLSMTNIASLPEGWLGKNHALFQGYQASTEEWLLFTDADVIFKDDSIDKAINYAVEHRLDHLTVLPEVESRSAMLNAVLGTFVLMLELRQKPWAVRNQRCNASLGVGAFNMVRRKAYIRAGTHQQIAMRPDDDLKLAEAIKASGGSSDVVYGEDQIGLEWYTSVNEFVNGLMKNTYSIFNYRWWFMVVAGILPTFVFFVSPILFLLGNGICKLVLCAVMVCQALIFTTNRGVTSHWWHFLTIPFTGLLMIYILLRSSIMTIIQGGIYWRNSFYSLDELRKSKL